MVGTNGIARWCLRTCGGDIEMATELALRTYKSVWGSDISLATAFEIVEAIKTQHALQGPVLDWPEMVEW